MYQSTRLADAQLDANDANGKIFSSSDDGVTWSNVHTFNCLLYTSDAADERSSVDLGGRRIIKKQNKKQQR